MRLRETLRRQLWTCSHKVFIDLAAIRYMERFQEYRDEAKKRLKVADHLLNVTHPMLKDPKLLTTVLEDLYLVYENGMNSVLEHERLFKNISDVPEGISPRIEVFKDVAPRFEMERHMDRIANLRHVLTRHKKSPMEFIRGEKFVIADENYSLETLTPEGLKEHLDSAKDFVEKVEEVVSKNERIFGRG